MSEFLGYPLQDHHHAGHDGAELYRDEGDHGEGIVVSASKLRKKLPFLSEKCVMMGV